MAPHGITKNWQFQEIYRRGTREAGRWIVLYFLPRDEGGINPGFVASKKVGKAYQRNRAKRLMREIFRRLEGRIIHRNLWMVFIAAFSPEDVSYRELLEEVERSMQRAGLISGNG